MSCTIGFRTAWAENSPVLGRRRVARRRVRPSVWSREDVRNAASRRLGIVDREEVGDQVVFSFSRRDIRPVNENGEFDIDGEVAQEATQLVELVVQSLAPVDDAALLLFEDLTGFPFRNEQGELAFSFPPLVNLKIVPSVDFGFEFRWPAGETLYDYLEQPPAPRRFPRRLAVRR